MRPLIILFAKAPMAGKVKTRLLPVLTPQEAAGLHEAMVYDTAEMLGSLAAAADVELHLEGEAAAFPGISFVRRRQPPGDLGQRLYATLEAALALARPRAFILGSDSPGLPQSHVRNLLTSDAELALGPASDGGFWGIAARRVDPSMFEAVRWSAATTLADTRRSAAACGLSVALGAGWFDVDTPEDLLRLEAIASPGARTAAWMSDVAGTGGVAEFLAARGWRRTPKAPALRRLPSPPD